MISSNRLVSLLRTLIVLNKNAKRKIYINARFLTTQTSGVQRYAIELTKAFDKLIGEKYKFFDDIEMILLAPKNLIIDLKLLDIEIKTVGLLKGHLWEQIELPFYCQNGILLNLCNTGPIGFQRQIITIHDVAEYSIPNNFSFRFRKSYQLLHKALSIIAKKIITVSYFSRDEIVKYYGVDPNEINVIYEGSSHINAQEADDSIIQKYNLSEKPFVLAVSTINPNKNFSAIVNAFQFLKDFDCNLVIAGKKSEIFNQSENIVSKKSKYVGFVSDSELKSLYKHASCFVFPSFYEGFGLPPLEAMACGCPVIVAKSAALPEIFEDAVLYCDPSCPSSIAKQIRTILSDSVTKNRLANDGLNHAKKFSWSKCAKETLSVIEKIM